MDTRVRLGLRLPPIINRELEIAAREDYMTKNQKAIEIFNKWLDERHRIKELSRNVAEPTPPKEAR